MEERTDKERIEGEREVALWALNDDIVKSLASVYLINQGEGFGSIPKEVVHRKYLDAMNSDEGARYLRDSFYEQEDSGRGLDRNLSELKLTQGGSRTINDAILSLKISDVLSNMGRRTNLKGPYQGKYIRTLNKEDQKEVVASYNSSLLMNYASQAFGEAGQNPGLNLEKKFCESQPNNVVQFNGAPRQERLANVA